MLRADFVRAYGIIGGAFRPLALVGFGAGPGSALLPHVCTQLHTRLLVYVLTVLVH